jgi:hypothetical protein
LGTGLHYNQPLGAIGEGPKSEPLILELEPFGRPGTTRKVSLERQLFRPSVEPRPQPIYEVDPGIMYIDLTRATDDAFKAALAKVREARGLISDLRGYPNAEMGIDFLRYLTREPMNSAQMLIPIIKYPDHRLIEFDRFGRLGPFAAHPILDREKGVSYEWKGNQLFGNHHGNRGTVSSGRDRWRSNGGDQWQYQSIHSARRLPDYLDGHEGPEARWLAAPRSRHRPDSACVKNAGGRRRRKG